jgi:hypothetical protein
VNRDRAAEIVQWASGIDWPHVHAVVSVGYSDVPVWDVLRNFRPDCKVIVFEPQLTRAKPPDGCVLVHDLVSLRHAVGTGVRGYWRTEVMGAPEHHEEWGRRVSDTVAEAIRFGRSIELTSRANAMEWTAAGFAALPYLAGKVPLSRCSDVFRGRPGVVVGAGPSLDGALDALKRMEGRAAICAVSSALGALQAAGVQPDLVTTVEARGKPFDQTLGLPIWERAVLAPGSHVAPVVYEAPARAIMPALQAVGAVGTWLCQTFKIPALGTGGSVSTLAYSILRMLGCDPIIMVGVDCAVRGDGSHVYAANTLREPGETLPPIVQSQATAWGGIGTVPTTFALDSYRHWFETQALAPDRVGRINASVGGAKIAGWVELEPDKVADRIVADHGIADLAGQLVAAAAKAEAIDPVPIIAGLKEQDELAAKLGEQAAKAHACVSVLYDEIGAFCEASSAAPILSMAGQAPLKNVIFFPTGDQLKALEDSLRIMVERASEVHEMTEAAIAALGGGVRDGTG